MISIVLWAALVGLAFMAAQVWGKRGFLAAVMAFPVLGGALLAWLWTETLTDPEKGRAALDGALAILPMWAVTGSVVGAAAAGLGLWWRRRRRRSVTF